MIHSPCDSSRPLPVFPMPDNAKADIGWILVAIDNVFHRWGNARIWSWKKALPIMRLPSI